MGKCVVLEGNNKLCILLFDVWIYQADTINKHPITAAEKSLENLQCEGFTLYILSTSFFDFWW